MASQYYPIILQVGSRFIRAGFAGDATPVLRRPTNSYDLRDAQITPIETHHAVPDLPEVDDPVRKDIIAEITKTTVLETNPQFLWSYDFTSTDLDKLESLLERIIHDLYTNDLLVDAKKCKVLLLEFPLCPLPLKKVLTKVLLYHIHAQSIRFYPEPVMSCIGAGSHSGLVVDIGWNYATVSVVYDLRFLYDLAKMTVRAGRKLHELMERELESIQGLPQEKAEKFEFIERFICECMYCPTEVKMDSRHDDMFLFDGLQIPQELRYKPLEALLFPQGIIQGDDNSQSITQLVITLFNSFNMDQRRDLSTRIIMTGGLSQIPGVKSRLLKELNKQLIESNTLHMSEISAILSLGSWEGASLYCSTALMSPSSSDKDMKRNTELFRDKYLSGESCLRDWTDEIYNR